jgi:hypothetical protein
VRTAIIYFLFTVEYRVPLKEGPMTTWVKLTPEQTHYRYRVPGEIANDERNIFYGSQRQPESSRFDDGPWHFLAFLSVPETESKIITFQICTIEFEFLEFQDFNPIEDQSGYLYLEPPEVLDLIDLMLNHAATMQPTNRISKPMFKKLSGSDFTNFNLQSNWFEYGVCYHQEVNPLLLESNNTQILLTFSRVPKPNVPITFSINQFPLERLKDSSFNPLDSSYGRVHLDQSGLKELAGLLISVVSL